MLNNKEEGTTEEPSDYYSTADLSVYRYDEREDFHYQEELSFLQKIKTKLVQYKNKIMESLRGGA